MQEINDAVRRCLRDNELNQIFKIQSNIGEFGISNLLCSVEEFKRQQILAVVDGVRFKAARLQRLNDPLIAVSA